MKYYLAHYIQHHIQHHILKYKKIAYYYLSEQLLTTQLIVTQDTLHSSFISKKICALHHRCFYKHSLFTTLLLVFTVDEMSYISNKYQCLNNLEKHQYFRKRDFIPLLHFEQKLVLSIAIIFRNIYFLSHFHYF